MAKCKRYVEKILRYTLVDRCTDRQREREKERKEKSPSKERYIKIAYDDQM